MKHEHHADINITIPTEDLSTLMGQANLRMANRIDQITDSVIKIIVVGTIAQIVKFHLSR